MIPKTDSKCKTFDELNGIDYIYSTMFQWKTGSWYSCGYSLIQVPTWPQNLVTFLGLFLSSCRVCERSTMVPGWFVSGGGHMNSRNQGFPAEHYTVLRWLRLFVFLTVSLFDCISLCQRHWQYLIKSSMSSLFSPLCHVYLAIET